MPDDLVIENLQSIIASVELIETRFSEITCPEDFIMSADGTLLLDSICMRLQIIGELLKKIQKMDATLFTAHQQIEWPKIMRLRDIISHHYDHVDHEIIYDICKRHLSDLKKALQEILSCLENK